MGNAADANTKWFNLFCQVECGGFAFNRRICCDDHFLCVSTFEALNEGRDLQFFRADTVKRSQDSMQYVITAMVIVDTFHRHLICRFLHYADGLLRALWISTNNTQVPFRQAETFLA